MKKLFQVAPIYLALVVPAIAFPLALSHSSAFAKDKDPEFQKKIDQKIAMVSEWARDNAITESFGAADVALVAKYKDMNNEKWKGLTVLDPLVRDLSKSPSALFLKTKKQSEPSLSEAFLSRADGTKVSFLSKPSSWSHKGKPKHDLPMSGKTWQGEVETDASTGTKQIQVAVPVLVGGKPVGSLVIGLKITLL